jgi:hypothetical protein
MRSVLIALEGTPTDTRIIDLAGELLTGRDVPVRLLHVIPVTPATDLTWPVTVVLEGYLAAEDCGETVAPMVEQLHTGLGCGHQGAPRLVPRHLVHHDDLFGVIERCGVAQQRQDSITCLGIYARQLECHGIDAARITRDSAIGTSAEVTWDTARQIGADLVIVGSRHAKRAWSAAGGARRTLAPEHVSFAVLIVPAVDATSPTEEAEQDAALASVAGSTPGRAVASTTQT